MSKQIAPVAVVAALWCAAPALAESESHLLTYDWGQGEPMPTLTFDSFDTKGGSRVLDDVRFDLEGSIAMTAEAENAGPDPIEDWQLNLSAVTRLEFTWDDEFGVTLGGASFPTLFADFAGSDGTTGSGDDYVLFEPQFAPVDGSWNVPGARLGEFADAGELSAAMLLTPSAGVGPGQVSFNFVEYEQSGSILVTYTFTPVPSSASVALLGCAAVCARRRTRRS